MKVDRRNSQLRRTLDSLAGARARTMPEDPVSVVRRYRDPRSRELAGLLASLLAYGRVNAILGSLEQLLGEWGEDPAGAVARGRHLEPQWVPGFRYRWTDRSHIVALLEAVRQTWEIHGSLGQALAHEVDRADGDFEAGLSVWTGSLRDRAVHRAGPSRALRFLLADPAGASAGKRLRLYLRWMIRPEDGVDLGLWSELLPTRDLIVPLDTHWARMAPRLGWTRRRTADGRMAREITAVLRRARPEDPLLYDFPICHFGIEGGCPTQLHWRHCVPCPLRPVCRTGKRRVAGAVARGAVPTSDAGPATLPGRPSSSSDSGPGKKTDPL